VTNKIFFLLITLTMFGVNFSAAQIQDSVVVNLLNESTLIINGSTNMNAFTCRLEQDLSSDTLDVFASRASQSIRLQQAAVKVRAENFACGKRKITRDMHKTLKSDEHPYIVLNFTRVDYSVTDSLDYSIPEVQATAAITIAGVEKTYSIPFKNVAFEGDVLSFKGKKELQMSTFNLDPPSPLFGLIKVDDAVEVEFYLYIRILKA